MSQDVRALVDAILNGESIQEIKAMSGGCINACFKIRLASGETYFLKLAPHDAPAGFLAREAEGLSELRGKSSLLIPRVIDEGCVKNTQYLLLEYFEKAHFTEAVEESLGRGLAELHSHTSQHFGFYKDNYIGSTEQANGKSDIWSDFFWDKRLFPQLKKAERKGYKPDSQTISRLKTQVEQILSELKVEASLIHGDLWSGNVLALSEGRVALIDPAVHYAHSECDLAMTEMFGGFGLRFYQSYQYHRPLAPGYKKRKTIYLLYHWLNHLNLFGSMYRSQVEQSIQSIVAW